MNIVPSAYIDNRNMPMQSDAYSNVCSIKSCVYCSPIYTHIIIDIMLHLHALEAYCIYPIVSLAA